MRIREEARLGLEVAHLHFRSLELPVGLLNAEQGLSDLHWAGQLSPLLPVALVEYQRVCPLVDFEKQNK